MGGALAPPPKKTNKTRKIIMINLHVVFGWILNKSCYFQYNLNYTINWESHH